MKRVVLLKTQLVEAAKLAVRNDFSKQRLAVILLDNFIEIQLSELMKKQFAYDDCFTSRPPKFNYTLRKKILYNYDDMLKACVLEKLITREERDILNFCHDVRNNLYHQAKEEPLLTTIALKFLNDIVLKYQPDWRSGRDFMTMDIKDPYVTNDKNQSGTASNSKDGWNEFLSKYFICLPGDSKTVPALISEYLLIKVGTAKDYYQYLIDDHSNLSQSTENWELNEFLMFYSFYNVKEFELKNLKLGSDSMSYNKAHKEMIIAYKNNWTYVKSERLNTLEGHYKRIVALPGHKALSKFIQFRTEINMIHEALHKAASALDAEIETQIERLRERE